MHVARHDVAHELLCLLEYLFRIDQDFANVRLEVVADSANHQTTFLVNQEGAFLAVGSGIDGVPELQQIVQVPLQFFHAPADTCGAGNDAHASRDFQLCHHVAQFVTLFTLDTARYATATGIVGHQYQIASSQADVGCQRSAFIAAFVLFYLDDDFLAFAQHILNACTRHIGDVVHEAGARDFLEWQKAVAISAVIDKGSLEAGLDASDDAFVDVAFALFLAGGFNVQVYKFLTIDNGDTEFLGLCRIK